MLLALFFQAAAAAGPAPIPPVAHPTVITQPDWLRKPTGEDMAKFYPKPAAADYLEGRAVIGCNVTAEGDLAACQIDAESPPGDGFGQAALNLSTVFKMRPMTKDGQPVTGGHVRIPILFRMPGPTASLDFYPPTALSAHVEGLAVVRCTVAADFGVRDCATVLERPEGYGFALAAIKYASAMKLSPQSTAAPGAVFQAPIHFRLPPAPRPQPAAH